MLTLQSNLIGKYNIKISVLGHPPNYDSVTSILYGEVHQLFCPSCDNMLDVTSGSVLLPRRRECKIGIKKNPGWCNADNTEQMSWFKLDSGALISFLFILISYFFPSEKKIMLKLMKILLWNYFFKELWKLYTSFN